MKRARFALYVAIFLDLLAFGMAFPNLAVRLRDFGLSGAWVGLILASLFVTQFIVSPLWGRYSDRKGRRNVIALCTALSSASMLVYALIDHPLGVLLSRVLAGVAAANVVAAQAFLADYSDEVERTKVMGQIGAAISAGLIAGPAVGGFLSDAGGARLLGFVAAACSAAAALLVWLLLPSGPPPKPAEAGRRALFNFTILRALPQLKAMFWLAVGSWFALACLEGTFVPLLGARYEFPAPMLFWTAKSNQIAGGLIFSLESAFGVLIQALLLPWLALRISPRKLLFLGLALQGIGLCLTPFAPTLSILLLFSAAYSMGQGFANPTMNAACSKLTPPDRQGEVFGLLQGARSLGFWLGPALGNLLFEISVALPYAVAGGVALTAALAVGSMRSFRAIDAKPVSGPMATESA